ncbi:hypothetical protein L210DRAFT_3547522, partial [Boletus edulis BED1]
MLICPLQLLALGFRLVSSRDVDLSLWRSFRLVPNQFGCCLHHVAFRFTFDVCPRLLHLYAALWPGISILRVRFDVALILITLGAFLGVAPCNFFASPTSQSSQVAYLAQDLKKSRKKYFFILLAPLDEAIHRSRRASSGDLPKSAATSSLHFPRREGLHNRRTNGGVISLVYLPSGAGLSEMLRATGCHDRLDAGVELGNRCR